MKVLVLGASGMLGFAIHRVLSDRGYDVLGAVRAAVRPASAWCTGLNYVANVDVEDFDTVLRAIKEARATVVVNATGAKVETRSTEQIRRLFAVNSTFPRLMGAVASSLGVHFVHFSSDGVFDGRRGSYDEQCRPDASDLYGMSKFLGEPLSEGCLVLRTSILGRGIEGNDSLVDWFLGQRGSVRGFRHTVFSGLPVNEVADVLAVKVLSRPTPLLGLFHLSADPVSKYDLLTLIREAWRADGIQIETDDTVVSDRSLDSKLLRQEIQYQPPPWDVLVSGMRDFYTAVGSL